MSKNEELQRLERDLNEQAELREKLDAEIKRIAGAGVAQCDGLGYAITIEELERAAADLEKLDDDELDAAAGGAQDEKHTNWCIKSWYCFAALRHTNTESKDVACWSDYVCIVSYQKPLVPEVKDKLITCPALPGT